jgi:hypothetical protein
MLTPVEQPHSGQGKLTTPSDQRDKANRSPPSVAALGCVADNVTAGVYCANNASGIREGVAAVSTAAATRQPASAQLRGLAAAAAAAARLPGYYTSVALWVAPPLLWQRL